MRENFPRSFAAVVCVAVALAVLCAAAPAQTQKSSPVTAKHGKLAGADPPAKAHALRHGWAPPDVDDAVPPVEPNVACPLREVLAGAGERVKQLAKNLESFGATEQLVHEELDKSGKAHGQEKRAYSYLVSLREIRPGFLSVDEMRDGGIYPESFPAKIATMGLAAAALIFHPYYLDDFAMTCEGLGEWLGAPAWQVRFEQRPDRPSRIHAFNVYNRAHPVNLKGRAWIARKTHQVVRLETDLMEPLPQIRLDSEHVAITYAPVEFRTKKVALWLPESAELYMDFRGHHYHRRHNFTNFVLFSVEVEQQIKAPVIEP